MKLVKRGHVEAAVREQRREAAATRGAHPGLVRWLRERRPDVWREVQACSWRAVGRQSQVDPRYYSVRPVRCGKVPFCIRCAKTATRRRVYDAFAVHREVTPTGQKPAFLHIVQTSDAREDGRGWGYQAARDLSAFGDVVMAGLTHAYGEGIGATASYHDFGETGFARQYPHYDLTLNGWRLVGGAPEKLRWYELRNGGRARWDDAVQEAADSVFGPSGGRPNVEVGHLAVGEAAYYRVLSYQMRELVDMRKLDYDGQTCYWWSYKDHARTKYTPQAFDAGLAEYNDRLRAWKGRGSSRLHRKWGYLAPRLVSGAKLAFGGVTTKHGRHCDCVKCGRWEVVELVELENLNGQRPPGHERGRLDEMREAMSKWADGVEASA